MAFVANPEDTIVAPSTPPGVSALAVVRLSGSQAFDIIDSVFPSKDLKAQASHTLHYGTLQDGEEIIDEVVVGLFRAPRSYTKEDVVEISTHGSPFIVQRVTNLMIANGARMAEAGEFSKRAFMNGQFDLAQAEAVADLIHSDSEASHQAAISQMRGGFSDQIQKLREELIHFASMVELELDFSEEDVEFASREQLQKLINGLLDAINPLIESYQLGNVIKNGVPTVIAGKPNAGKSTLLNTLLNEERAIVSDIPGTTRDTIEDEISLGGIQFRFIDTAGLRETSDEIEAIGVERTRQKLQQADLILFLFDLSTEPLEAIKASLAELDEKGIPYLAIGNKTDLAPAEVLSRFREMNETVTISASSGEGISELKEAILHKVHLDEINSGNIVVTNVRHYQNLLQAKGALEDVLKGIDEKITQDFLALEIRTALSALSEITGQEITTEDLLESIFSKFCIGK